MNTSDDQAFREEAERLKLLDVDTQRQILALYREPADNPKLPMRDRQAALERVAALEKLLGLSRRKR
jgi:hypothetical protein